MQFDWFLSVLEQKREENYESYYIEAADKHLRFTHDLLLVKTWLIKTLILFSFGNSILGVQKTIF